MKIRQDFVTNSSSSSYIICFARVSDKVKAQEVINKYGINTYQRLGIEEMTNGYYEFQIDWAGIWLPVASIIEEHPDDEYIVIRDSCDASYNDYGDAIYDYDFSMQEAIDAITNDNGFDDIHCCTGEGRDG